MTMAAKCSTAEDKICSDDGEDDGVKECRCWWLLWMLLLLLSLLFQKREGSNDAMMRLFSQDRVPKFGGNGDRTGVVLSHPSKARGIPPGLRRILMGGKAHW